MKALSVTYRGGKFFVATDNDVSTPNRVMHERDNSLEFEHNFDAAVRKLCFKQGWHGTLVKGDTGRNQRVYVWADERRIEVEDTRKRLPNEEARR